METNHPLFIVTSLVGLTFIITGVIMLKFPPKKINSFYGYRTFSSMKSKERWDFAQNYSAKEMIKLGAILTLSGLLGLIYQPSASKTTIIIVGSIILSIITLLIRVESAIEKKFKTP